jgi:hypothetical protein
MSDGASLNLAMSVMADRARTKYEFVMDPVQVVERAIAWLQAER